MKKIKQYDVVLINWIDKSQREALVLEANTAMNAYEVIHRSDRTQRANITGKSIVKVIRHASENELMSGIWDDDIDFEKALAECHRQRRVRHYWLDQRVLESIFRRMELWPDKLLVYRDHLPSPARVEHVHYDDHRATLMVLVSSPHFDIVPTGAMIPCGTTFEHECDPVLLVRQSDGSFREDGYEKTA